jgi:hypothetical protein
MLSHIIPSLSNLGYLLITFLSSPSLLIIQVLCSTDQLTSIRAYTLHDYCLTIHLSLMTISNYTHKYHSGHISYILSSTRQHSIPQNNTLIIHQVKHKQCNHAISWLAYCPPTQTQSKAYVPISVFHSYDLLLHFAPAYSMRYSPSYHSYNQIYN